MRQTISDFVNMCAPCALQKPTILKGMVHHPLETVHRSQEVMYVDLIGPVTGIRSQYRYMLTCVDGYLLYLANSRQTGQDSSRRHPQCDVYRDGLLDVFMPNG